MLDLENRVAVITGATGGIGRAVANELARKKVNLGLVGRDGDALEKCAGELKQYSIKLTCFCADFSDIDEVEAVSARVLKEFGVVDILIHSAGFLSMGSIENAPSEDLGRHYKINVEAPFVLTRLILPALKQTKGQIVFVNSSAIQRAISDLAQYSASKFALKGLADATREAVNPYGVRVLSIYPGQTATPMQEIIYHYRGKTYQPEQILKPQDVAAAITNFLTMSPTAEITEIFIRPMLGN